VKNKIIIIQIWRLSIPIPQLRRVLFIDVASLINQELKDLVLEIGGFQVCSDRVTEDSECNIRPVYGFNHSFTDDRIVQHRGSFYMNLKLQILR